MRRYDMEWFARLTTTQRQAVTSWTVSVGIGDATCLIVRGQRLVGARVYWRDEAGKLRVHPDGERVVSVVRPLNLTAPAFL